MKFDWKSLFGHFEQEPEEETAVTGEFSSCSDSELLDKIKTEQWEQLEEKDRLELFQEMENRAAFAEGRDPAKIIAPENGGYYGCYSSGSNQIEIDVSGSSSYEALDTYVHEQNHAVQWNCIDNGMEKDGASIDMIRTEFHDYAQVEPEYSMQCNEMDSNNQAAEFMLSQADRYANDPNYREYVMERVEHYSEVNESIRTMECRRECMHESQADKALENGLISEEQHESLLERDQDPDQIDPEVSKSIEMESRLRELNHELGKGKTSIDYLDAEPAEDIGYTGICEEAVSEGITDGNDYLGMAATQENGNDVGAEETSGMESSGSHGMEQ